MMELKPFYKSCKWCSHFKEDENGYWYCDIHAVYAFECPDFALVEGFTIPEENKNGEWLEYDHDIFGCRQIDSVCSVCGHLKYTAGSECRIGECPNCGARLDGE